MSLTNSAWRIGVRLGEFVLSNSKMRLLCQVRSLVLTAADQVGCPRGLRETASSAPSVRR